jgi:hypothetical protein
MVVQFGFALSCALCTYLSSGPVVVPVLIGFWEEKSDARSRAGIVTATAGGEVFVVCKSLSVPLPPAGEERIGSGLQAAKLPTERKGPAGAAI